MSEAQRGDGSRVNSGPGRYDIKTVGQSVEGAPEFSFWSGIKNWNDRKKRHGTTYRCASRQRLEPYTYYSL